jgi:hypothetical protein
MLKQITSIAGKKARIQYTSSLYVDKFEKIVGAHFLKPVASVLVLNGNIGKPQSAQTYDFLQHCSRIWTDIIYIPGDYELNSGDKQIDLMKKQYKPIQNVHVLYNSSHYISSIDTLFLGSFKTKWLFREFNEKNKVYPVSTKFVGLNSSILNSCMVHPNDRKYEQTDNYDIYPKVNAWICGYSRGAHIHTFANGVVCAYNALGPIDGNNDFSKKLGWSRSAYLDIPNTIIED